jgi:hypothetical protein
MRKPVTPAKTDGFFGPNGPFAATLASTWLMNHVQRRARLRWGRSVNGFKGLSQEKRTQAVMAAQTGAMTIFKICNL